MAQVTPKQLVFLKSQNVPLTRVFDASGMPRSSYQKVMKDLGMLVAIGVTPCKKAGHTIRTRKGHCAQCGTHNIAFTRRFEENNTLYVASSASHNVVKVGVTNNIRQRETSLNSTGYGGIRDWNIEFHFACKQAGRMEHRIHAALSFCRIARSYRKEGTLVDCQELFSCSVAQAIETCRTVTLASVAI